MDGEKNLVRKMNMATNKQIDNPIYDWVDVLEGKLKRSVSEDERYEILRLAMLNFKTYNDSQKVDILLYLLGKVVRT